MNASRLTAITTFAGLAGFAAFLPTSCSSSKACKASYTEVGDIGAACVATRSSTAADYVCFDKPQMCPSLTPIFFNLRKTTSTTAVNLLLENRGEAPMKITSIKVRGDTRCAFKNAMFAPAVGSSIEPGDSMVVRFKYFAPAAEGEDHATIEILSDSENLPTLNINVCGKSVANPPAMQMHVDCQDKKAADYTDCFEK
ncbi:MAG: hypothetical protein U1E65_29790 [Myxococcota bacterium]